MTTLKELIRESVSNPWSTLLVGAVVVVALTMTAGCPVSCRGAEPLKVRDVRAFQYTTDSTDWGVKAGDDGVQIAFQMTFAKDPGGFATVATVELDRPGWKVMNALDDGQKHTGPFIDDTEPVTKLVWFRVPAGAIRKVRVQFHGGPNRDAFIKALKEGKGVRIWQE